MNTVPASIPVIQWAAQRAGLDDAALAKHYPKWPLWLSGEAQPTLRQLEDFANRTHTAIGYFFLPQPPSLPLPIPDFRTLRDEAIGEPSSNLLDTIYLCQQRQDWFRDHARLHGLPALSFIGSVTIQEAPVSVAQQMRETLALATEVRQRLSTWTEALRQLIARTEEAGVMVMATSIVGSNSHRKLDVGEFRGFALADDLAPLVFLNGSDSKSAQMFTLAHELAHLWLGVSGVSDTETGRVPEQQIEHWCNQVAAELLMPMQALRAAHEPKAPVAQEIQRLARMFKVSTLVALRRLFDAGFIGKAALWQHYREELERLRSLERKGSGGGDFYNSLGARTSKRFARAIVSSTLEGLTPFTDAFRMLGVRKTETFYEAARELGVTA